MARPYNLKKGVAHVDDLVLDGDNIVATGETQDAISDITNSASGTEIATAVNSIIAALVEFGIVEEDD